MKHTFTLIASLLIASTLTIAQNRNIFDWQSHHQTKTSLEPQTSPAQKKGIQPALMPELKSATVNTTLTDITHYGWDGNNWFESGKDEYDAQGRPVIITQGNMRNTYAYNTDGWTLISTMLMRDNDTSPWVTYTQNYQKEDEDGNTIWEEQYQNMGGGTMMLMWGNKNEITETTVGNIETYQYIQSSYQFISQSYVVSNGYKEETEKDGQGRIIRKTYYSHNGTIFEIESNDVYTYDGSGKLTGISNMYNENSTTRYEKYEMIYNSGSEPDIVYYYESANGTDFVYKGRYKDVIWINWATSLATLEMDPKSYLGQKVIDPLGDKTDNANYTNMEKLETTTIGSYEYRWIDAAWVLTGQYTTETVLGVTTTIDMWMDYDEDLAQFTGGGKNETISEGNLTTEIVYSFDYVNKTLIPSTKEVTNADPNSILNYEQTHFEWLDVNDDGNFAWEKTEYEKYMYTTTHIENTYIQYRLDGEIDQSSDYKTDLDAYGNPTYTYSANQQRNELDALVTTVTESTYSNEYSDGWLSIVIQQIKENNSPTYVNKEKKVYKYGIPSQTPTTEITGLDVYPTVVSNSVTVKTGEPAQLLFANTNGGVVKMVQLPVGIHEVPVADLPSGLYILTVKTSNASTNFKIIKR